MFSEVWGDLLGLSAWIKHSAPWEIKSGFCLLCAVSFHHAELCKTGPLLWWQFTSPCHNVSWFCIIYFWQMEFKILLDFYLSLTHVICLILSHREAIYSDFVPLLIIWIECVACSSHTTMKMGFCLLKKFSLVFLTEWDMT